MSFGRHSEYIERSSARDWGVLGDDLYRQGRYLESAMMYEKALEIAPHDKSLWNSKGLALCRLKKLEEALEA